MTRVVDLARTRSPRRVAALAAVALLSAGSLTACQWTSPIQTDASYEASDGISVTAGPVHVSNLLIVSGAAGGAGTLVGAVANSGSEPATVSFATEGGSPVQVTVPAGGQLSLSSADGTRTTLRAVKAAPGSWTNVQVTTPTAGTVTANVPVQYPYSPYEDVAPAGFTPRPSASTEDDAEHSSGH